MELLFCMPSLDNFIQGTIEKTLMKYSASTDTKGTEHNNKMASVDKGSLMRPLKLSTALRLKHERALKAHHKQPTSPYHKGYENARHVVSANAHHLDENMLSNSSLPPVEIKNERTSPPSGEFRHRQKESPYVHIHDNENFSEKARSVIESSPFDEGVKTIMGHWLTQEKSSRIPPTTLSGHFDTTTRDKVGVKRTADGMEKANGLQNGSERSNFTKKELLERAAAYLREKKILVSGTDNTRREYYDTEVDVSKFKKLQSILRGQYVSKDDSIFTSSNTITTSSNSNTNNTAISNNNNYDSIRRNTSPHGRGGNTSPQSKESARLYTTPALSPAPPMLRTVMSYPPDTLHSPKKARITSTTSSTPSHRLLTEPSVRYHYSNKYVIVKNNGKYVKRPIIHAVSNKLDTTEDSCEPYSLAEADPALGSTYVKVVNAEGKYSPLACNRQGFLNKNNKHGRTFIAQNDSLEGFHSHTHINGDINNNKAQSSQPSAYNESNSFVQTKDTAHERKKSIDESKATPRNSQTPHPPQRPQPYFIYQPSHSEILAQLNSNGNMVTKTQRHYTAPVNQYQYHHSHDQYYHQIHHKLQVQHQQRQQQWRQRVRVPAASQEQSPSHVSSLPPPPPLIRISKATTTTTTTHQLHQACEKANNLHSETNIEQQTESGQRRGRFVKCENADNSEMSLNPSKPCKTLSIFQSASDLVSTLIEKEVVQHEDASGVENDKIYAQFRGNHEVWNPYLRTPPPAHYRSPFTLSPTFGRMHLPELKTTRCSSAPNSVCQLPSSSPDSNTEIPNKNDMYYPKEAVLAYSCYYDDEQPQDLSMKSTARDEPEPTDVDPETDLEVVL